jgi:drug/metabolite transporter (DMT)-like permease
MSWLGLLAALGAMLAWGFGDYFIQKTTRAVGSVKALFYICAPGFLVLTLFLSPDDWSALADPRRAALLTLTALVTFFTAFFNFEALKRGKIAVIEPIVGLEMPLTVGLSMLILGERVGPARTILIICVFIGIMLAVTSKLNGRLDRTTVERGAALAGISAVGMALTNFLTGVSSQETSPVLAIWFVHGVLAALSLPVMARRGQARDIPGDLKRHGPLLAAMSLFDNAAWLCFAAAAAIIPISIATAVSESYIVLAVILGLAVSKEKAARHQIVGIAFAAAGVIALAALTG